MTLSRNPLTKFLKKKIKEAIEGNYAMQLNLKYYQWVIDTKSEEMGEKQIDAYKNEIKKTEDAIKGNDRFIEFSKQCEL